MFYLVIFLYEHRVKKYLNIRDEWITDVRRFDFSVNNCTTTLTFIHATQWPNCCNFCNTELLYRPNHMACILYEMILERRYSFFPKMFRSVWQCYFIVCSETSPLGYQLNVSNNIDNIFPQSPVNRLVNHTTRVHQKYLIYGCI